jgi:organic radical activating enzyme
MMNDSGIETVKLIESFITFQGESPSCGKRVLLTRFKYCNQKCPWCFGVKEGSRNPRVVLANKKNKKIQDVRVGDKLLTFNNDGELVETEVINTISREVDNWYEVQIEDRKYFVTEEHPFFTTRGLVQTKDLKIGDMIYHSTPKDKMSYIMKNKNPMFNKNSIIKSVENKDFKFIAEKTSITVQTKIKNGEYIHPFRIISKEKKKEVLEKISNSKIGFLNPNWKGGIFINYEKLKKEVSKGLCVCCLCGSNYNLNVHHKDGNSRNDLFENLTVVCRSCHNYIHEIGYNFWKNNRKDGKQLVNGFEVKSIKFIDKNSYSKYYKPKKLKVYNISCHPYDTYLVDYMWVHNCDTRVKMKNTIEGTYLISMLNKIVCDNNLGLLVTGGEPTFDIHLEDTFNLLSIINYPFAIVESNGYQLNKLIHLLKSIKKSDKIKYIFSPKSFTETQDFINIQKLKELYTDHKELFEGENGIYIRLVSEKFDDNSYMIDEIIKLKLNSRTFISPCGDTREKLLQNSPRVISMCNNYGFNFSTRVHILHDFI